jgi:tetratricopeptide (TPR) repeat protein
MRGVADTLHALKRNQEAIVAYSALLKYCQSALGDSDPNTARAYAEVASSYSVLGEGGMVMSLEYHKKALAARLKCLPDDHKDITESMLLTAYSHFQLGQYREALGLVNKVLARGPSALDEQARAFKAACLNAMKKR